MKRDSYKQNKLNMFGGRQKSTKTSRARASYMTNNLNSSSDQKLKLSMTRDKLSISPLTRDGPPAENDGE